MQLSQFIPSFMRFTNMTVEDEDERMRVLTRTALLCGGSTHVVLLFVFHALQVPEMVYVNVVSVSWWLAALVWHLRTGHWFWPLTSIWPEMVLHAIVATWFVGWGTGFWIYCVIMIAAMCLLPRMQWLSFVTYIVTVVLFGAWYLFDVNFAPAYVLDPGVMRLQFVVNATAAIGFMVLTINLSVTLQRRAWHIVEQFRAKAEEERLIAEVALENLKTTQTQLVQQEKLASLGKLTAGIAHEIKNPLNFVTNFAALSKDLAEDLREAVTKNDCIDEVLVDLEQNAERIYKHGQRANDIVKNMMQHASSRQRERNVADLNNLVQQHVDLAYHGKRVQAPDVKVSIEQELGFDVGEVELVSHEIGRVLLNLFGNAFDAVCECALTDSSGTYTPKVLVSTKRVEDQVEVRIADNGRGIPARLQNKVFEPFFTTKPAGSGTGLGLSLSHDIVHQGHGGTLTVESVEGQGATFIMRLPASMHAVPAMG